MLGGRGPLDGQKRMIGAPHSPSPVANRSSYKPPTLLKRPADNAGRVPLNDLPANGPVSAAADGPDSKRQRTTD
jgi:DNA repair and recombination protein RAD52